MKKVILSLIEIMVCISLFAQAPDAFKYQAVLRNADGTIMAEENVTIVISILKSDLTTSVFEETHSTTTSSLGIINLNIGSIEDLSTVDWTLDEYFIEISINSTVIGTSQLLSVPYALNAKIAETVSGTLTETDPVYLASSAASITATDITNLDNISGTNTGDQDISGIATNATAISTIEAEQTTQNAAIALNTAKVGISTAQVDAIIANTGKDTTGIYHTNRTALDAVSGVNTGDQNLSAYATKDMAGANITNLADPTEEQDAATKVYVDNIFKAQLEILNEINLNSGNNGMLFDIDGNVYKTIKIGDQIWMAENLKTTSYNNGTAITLVTDNTAWSNLITGAYCWYSNDGATYKDTYGALYNWYTVNAGNLCPTGWHVPTDTEWTTLTDYLGGIVVAGGKLKETGTTHWTTPNTGATNETGFTALPGGYRFDNGSFLDIGNFGYWWSASLFNGSNAWYRSLDYNNSDVSRNFNSKECGFSVRCVRD